MRSPDRTTLKIILPLIVSVAAVSLLFAAYQVRTEKRILRNDLSRRAEILGESLQENVGAAARARTGEEFAAAGRTIRTARAFERRRHLHDATSAVLAITPDIAPAFRMRPTAASRAAQEDTGAGEFLSAEQSSAGNTGPAPIYVYALPLHSRGGNGGNAGALHDTSYIDRKVSLTLRDSLLTALVQTLLITGLAFVLVRWTFTGPLTRTAKWLRTLRTGQPNAPAALAQGEILDQINNEVSHLARDLNTQRAAAEQEARLRDTNNSLWTAERLRVSLRGKLQDKPLCGFRIASRTCTCSARKDKIDQRHCAGERGRDGLEPVLRACNGTWIANGWAARTASGGREGLPARSGPIIRVTPCAASGSAMKRIEAITKAFRTRGSGRSGHIAHTRPIFPS